MANHCVYAICCECKTEFCLLRCNYTCQCGRCIERVMIELGDRE